MTQACTNGPNYKVDLEKGTISCDDAKGKNVGARSWTCHYIDKNDNNKDQTKVCKDQG